MRHRSVLAAHRQLWLSLMTLKAFDNTRTKTAVLALVRICYPPLPCHPHTEIRIGHIAFLRLVIRVIPSLENVDQT